MSILYTRWLCLCWLVTGVREEIFLESFCDQSAANLPDRVKKLNANNGLKIVNCCSEFDNCRDYTCENFCDTSFIDYFTVSCELFGLIEYLRIIISH